MTHCRDNVKPGTWPPLDDLISKMATVRVMMAVMIAVWCPAARVLEAVLVGDPQFAVMISGTSMADGDQKWSQNGQYRLQLYNGNLELQEWSANELNSAGHYTQTVWSICASGQAVSFKLQDDGNMVLYDGNRTALWAHNQAYGPDGISRGPYLAFLTDSGDLVEYQYKNVSTIVWTSASPSTQNAGLCKRAKFKYGTCQ